MTAAVSQAPFALSKDAPGNPGRRAAIEVGGGGGGGLDCHKRWQLSQILVANRHAGICKCGGASAH